MSKRTLADCSQKPHETIFENGIEIFINRNDMSVQAGTDRYGDRDTDPAPHQEHEAGPKAAGVVRDDARPARADRESV